MKRYEKGSVITGKVTGIEDYGIFVGIDEEHSGLIHISEISNGFVRNVNDYAKVGEEINVCLIEDYSDTKHMKLSIKEIKNRRDKSILPETGEGFKPLKDNLDKWIREYNNK